QEIVVVEQAGQQCLADIRWNRHVVPHHQIQVLGRWLSGKAHSQKRLKAAHALQNIRGKDARYETEKLGSQDGHGVVAAKFRNSVDEAHPADPVLTEVSKIYKN